MIRRGVCTLLICGFLGACGGRNEVELAKIETLCFGWGAGNIAEMAVRKKYLATTGILDTGYSDNDFVREIQAPAQKLGVDIPEKLILRIWRESPPARGSEDLRQGSELVTYAMTLGRAACRDHYGLKYEKDLRR